MAKKPSKKLEVGDTLPPEVAELFEKHQKYLAAGKANYAKADKILEQILERCEPGVQHTLPEAGKRPPTVLTLVDQFADANSVWCGASAKRLTIKAKEVKPQDR
jgi:hypothetical protein